MHIKHTSKISDDCKKEVDERARVAHSKNHLEISDTKVSQKILRNYRLSKYVKNGCTSPCLLEVILSHIIIEVDISAL